MCAVAKRPVEKLAISAGRINLLLVRCSVGKSLWDRGIQNVWRIPRSRPVDDEFGAVDAPLSANAAPPLFFRRAQVPYNAVRLLS